MTMLTKSTMSNKYFLLAMSTMEEYAYHAELAPLAKLAALASLEPLALQVSLALQVLLGLKVVTPVSLLSSKAKSRDGRYMISRARLSETPTGYPLLG